MDAVRIRTSKRKRLGAVRPAAAIAVLAAAAVAAALLLASCAGKADGTYRPNPKLRTVELRIGDARVKAEVALSYEERERGLMFRKTLTDGAGMLFVFEVDQRPAFWMKNVSLPLSLAYISSGGIIRQIVDLTPFSEATVQSERSVRYALEVPKGWFNRAGVAVGDLVEIPSLD